MNQNKMTDIDRIVRLMPAIYLWAYFICVIGLIFFWPIIIVGLVLLIIGHVTGALVCLAAICLIMFYRSLLTQALMRWLRENADKIKTNS